MRLEQVLPCSPLAHGVDGGGRHTKLGRKCLGGVFSRTNVGHLLFGQLRSRVLSSAENTIGSVPLSVFHVLFVRTFSQVSRVDAGSVPTEMPSYEAFPGRVSAGKDQGNNMHTQVFSSEENGGVSGLAIVERLLYALVHFIGDAALHGFLKPAEPFTIKGFPGQRVTMGKLSSVVTGTKTRLVERPIATFDAARLLGSLLPVVRATKALGLVGLIASGNRTNTFHAGSAPLGGLKGVYHTCQFVQIRFAGK